MESAAFGVAWFCAVVLLVAGVLRLWPGLARAVLGTDPPEREASLDGLRGLLGLGVVLHHGIIAHGHFGGLPWQAPRSNFDNLAGQAAVALFFMTSAYLFWGRVVRRGTLDWAAFYRSRVRRLVPMYAVAVALLLLIVAVETDFELRVPPAELAQEIARWGSFSLLDLPPVKGLMDTGTILSVTWTLRFEWLFYLALPFLAYAYGALRPRWLLYVAVFAAAAGLGKSSMAMFFVTGGLAVHAVSRWGGSAWGRRSVSGAGLLALAALVAAFHDAYAAAPALLLFPVFVAALLARGPWAVLNWPPLRFLGHISYSVYLLHNPVIHAVGAFAFGASTFAGLGPLQMYLALAATGALVIAVSTATYLFVEKPFLAGTSWLRRPAQEPLSSAARSA